MDEKNYNINHVDEVVFLRQFPDRHNVGKKHDLSGQEVEPGKPVAALAIACLKVVENRLEAKFDHVHSAGKTGSKEKEEAYWKRYEHSNSIATIAYGRWSLPKYLM